MCTPPSSSPHLVGQQAHFVEHGCVRFVLGVQMPHEGHLPAALGDVALDVHTVLAGKGSQSCVRGGGGTALNVAVKGGSEQYEFPARSGAPAAFRVSGCALTGRPGRPPHPSCSRWYMSG